MRKKMPLNAERDPSLGRLDPETQKMVRIKFIKQQLLNEGLSDDKREQMIAELQELENLDDQH